MSDGLVGDLILNEVPRLERLVTEQMEVVVLLGPEGPGIAYWGAPLGDALDVAEILAALDAGSVPATAVWRRVWPLVPAHGAGCEARPGVLGARLDGSDFAPQFRIVDVQRRGGDAPGESADLVVRTVDEQAGLALEFEFTLAEALVMRAALTNTVDITAGSDYRLESLSLSVPVPEHAGELLTLGGRWISEFALTRHPWTTGTLSAENRRGRTSHESVPLVIAATPGVGEWAGEAWSAHLAWSGNHRWVAEHTVDGRAHLQLGELLHPGEIVLRPGDTYRTPEVVITYSSAGLTPLSWGFHRHLRARPTHPRRARPVTFNSWEATYFDHDLTRLQALAAAAADVGAERFVLDDGWFGARRDDTAGLGDWWVSPDAHPEGLEPLITTVRDLGMEFGIWVEPEMANPDSDLLRAHPDWLLSDDRYEPVMWRNQLVVDLTRPAAFDHLHGALDALLATHDISFVKWDMNRPHVRAANARRTAGTHAQTLAVYRLLDLLRADHPGVEFESCASGGGRIDHEILRRTERVWTSDNNDPLARQRIQHGASLLIPPEVMGAHVGPRRAHTTGRVSDIEFRVVTALLGHLGIEADLTRLDASELSVVRDGIAWYRVHRDLLHSGDLVRVDLPEPFLGRGVLAADRTRGVVTVAALDLARTAVMPPLRLPGLHPEARYRVRRVDLGRPPRTVHLEPPAWWERGEVVISGALWARQGLRLPTLAPGAALLLEFDEVEST